VSGDEDEWIRTMVRENQELERSRRIQPGTGRAPHEAPSDWWILGIVLIVIIAGAFS
jgi:hypothetical protein